MNFWGRIFFQYDNTENLCGVKGQPLDNHVSNTCRILNHFSADYFYEPTRDRLLESARHHDDGKKDTFRIIDNMNKAEKKRWPANSDRFSYSFAGHRFRVPGKEPYIDGLIRSHHEFSVTQINREKAKLPPEEKRHFADDLYLLCMADQLEAELAVKTVDSQCGDTPPRTFMEFATHRLFPQDHPHTFTVVPWPFESGEFNITLALKIPQLKDISQVSARQIQETFETGVDFADETLTITLRRN